MANAQPGEGRPHREGAAPQRGSTRPVGASSLRKKRTPSLEPGRPHRETSKHHPAGPPKYSLTTKSTRTACRGGMPVSCHRHTTLMQRQITMFCAQYLAVQETPTGDRIKPLPCRSWRCEYCQPHRRRMLIAQACAGNPNKMLTLTVNTSVGDSPEHRRELLHKAWILLKKRIERKLKIKSLPYLAFVEKTQRGEPHVHILLRCKFIHFKWIRRNMKELLQSPIIWIEQIKNTRKAAYYVTKYCTKAPAQFANTKRYWSSQNYEEGRTDKKAEYKGRLRNCTIIRQNWTDFKAMRKKWNWTWQELPDHWVEFTRPACFAKVGDYWMPIDDHPDIPVNEDPMWIRLAKERMNRVPA
jgi:hypothetical protein